MKSENFIQLMWTKGIYLNSQLYKYELNSELIKIKTLNNFYIKLLKYRLESKIVTLNKKNKLLINILISKYSSINYTLDLNYTLVILRLYLIKTYKGKCFWLSKPTNGQRSWSNANTIKFTSTKYKKYLKLNNWY
jgi:ribosomal protein S13